MCPKIVQKKRVYSAIYSTSLTACMSYCVELESFPGFHLISMERMGLEVQKPPQNAFDSEVSCTISRNFSYIIHSNHIIHTFLSGFCQNRFVFITLLILGVEVKAVNCP
jgi:hypothetical protein